MKQIVKSEIKTLAKLAMPVIIAQLAQTGITFVDTIMAGHYPDNGASLAGVAIGASIWLPTILFGQGLLSVLTPIVANLNGASKRDKIAEQTRHGLMIAVILSVFMMLFLYNSDKLILWRQDHSNPIDPEMVYVAVHFLRSIMWGVPALLFYFVYRFQCEGVSNTKPAMYIMFSALILNIPINYILIYGHLGLPAFGGVGCGITAAIVFWMMFIAIKCFTLFSSTQKDIRLSKSKKLLDLSIIRRIVFLGLPLAMAYFFEISLFAIIALLIAPLGKTTVAAHQIIFTISSLTFAIPLSLGVATSIRVGYLLGNKQASLAKKSAYISLTVSFFLALFIAIALLASKSLFISFFTSEPEVIAICLQLIVLLALYQLSDYLQVTASNVLRGYKDTGSIFYITFIAYWIIGLPLGYILGLTDLLTPKPMGVSGFWAAITIGLTFAAVLLIVRMIYIQKQPIDKILYKASR